MMAELLTPVEGYSLTEQFLTMLMSVIVHDIIHPAFNGDVKAKREEKRIILNIY